MSIVYILITIHIPNNIDKLFSNRFVIFYYTRVALLAKLVNETGNYLYFIVRRLRKNFNS